MGWNSYLPKTCGMLLGCNGIRRTWAAQLHDQGIQPTGQRRHLHRGREVLRTVRQLRRGERYGHGARRRPGGAQVRQQLQERRGRDLLPRLPERRLHGEGRRLPPLPHHPQRRRWRRALVCAKVQQGRYLYAVHPKQCPGLRGPHLPLLAG